jgi:hypothetical protein
MWFVGRRWPLGRYSVFTPDVTDYERSDLIHLDRLTKTMKYSCIWKFNSDKEYQQHPKIHHCCLQHSNNYRLCPSLGGYSLASQWEGLGSVPGQSMWDLLWKKWQWDRFFYESNRCSPDSVILRMFLAHSFIYHQRYIILAIGNITKYSTLNSNITLIK